MAKIVLELQGVSKRYGHSLALNGVDLSLRRGEVLALLGENGAGKSTLVKTLAGVIRPDEGTLRVAGEEVHFSSGEDARSAGISLVTQEFSLVRSMTIAQNLALGGGVGGVVWSPRSLRAHARRALLVVGMGHLDPDRPVEELSVAEMQLLEIARAVTRDAKVVIFDEPTAALSDHEIARVEQIVGELKRRGVSVIYVTHRLDEVFRIADRVLVMRNGRSLPPVDRETLTPQSVITLMLGRELGTMYPDRSSGSAGEEILRVEELQSPGLVEPVSFTIHSGQILGLTGQMGSGANSVVRALGGAVPTVSGRVILGDGQVASLGNRVRGTKERIAFCSGDRKSDGIFSALSVKDNMSAPWLKKVSRAGFVSTRREMKSVVAAATDFALDPRRVETPVGELSGGNQQKVALGRWVGIDPLLFVAEEPTRGVDVGARAEIYQRLRELADRGVAVVVASSDTSEILGLCDIIGSFYRGRLTRIGDADSWTEHELVTEVMHRPTQGAETS